VEKTKAARVVNDLTLAKHIDVEVLAQTDSRSRLVVNFLGGKDAGQTEFHAPRPVSSSKSLASSSRPHRLFRLSDALGTLSFDLVKDKAPI
jgi:gelsolin